ncbi:MAG: Toxin coregulated pilus biosynthesis protein E [Legionellaceae bacterium]
MRFYHVINAVIQKMKYALFLPTQQQALLEDIAALIEDGVPLSQAIDMLARLTTGLTKEVVMSIASKIAEGKPMAEGLIGWYPPHVIEIIRAGEEGGAFTKTLATATQLLTQKNIAISSLISALSYPFVVMSMGLAVTVFINHSVFKEFRAVRPIEMWPSNAQFVVWLGSIIENYWFLFIVIIGVSILAITQMLRNYIGNARQWIDLIPGLALYRKLTAARFMETLGLLITNGVVFKKALKIMQYNANPYLAWHLLTMEFKLGGGRQNIAEVLDTGLIDKNDLVRLKIIAQGRGFEHALLRQGRRASQQGLQKIKISSKTFGAVMLALAALLAAFLITSVYSVGTLLGGA